MTTSSIRTYLDPDLAKQVARLARAQNRSESSLIAEAVKSLVTKTDELTSGAAQETIRRQLNRVEKRLDRLMLDQMLTTELMLLYVRLWLEHNPRFEDDVTDAVAQSADARFDRFLQFTRQAVANGGSDDMTELRMTDPRLGRGTE